MLMSIIYLQLMFDMLEIIKAEGKEVTVEPRYKEVGYNKTLL